MEYTIVLSKEMLEVVSVALGNMPYVKAAPVIAELQRQLAKTDSEE